MTTFPFRAAVVATGSRLTYGIRPETATLQLNIDDGGVRRPRAAQGTHCAARQYEYGPWLRLAFFAVLLLAPLPWARESWRKALDGHPQNSN